MPFDVVEQGALRAPLRSLNSQVAAIPVRWTANGPEVLLITTRKQRHWIVPKGWAECDAAAHDCAAREAYEEAGVTGRVEPFSLGMYEYWKKSSQGRLFFQVTVYALHVERVLTQWPERDRRKRAWFSPEVAAKLTGNDALAALILAAVQVKRKPDAERLEPIGMLN